MYEECVTPAMENSENTGMQMAYAIRMEMEKLAWRHQAEMAELEFNHDLSMKEYKNSLEIRSAKVSFLFYDWGAWYCPYGYATR